MTGITIVRFTPKHVPAAVTIFCHVFSEPPWNEYWTGDLATSRLTDVLGASGGQGWAAVVDSHLVGFALGSRVISFDGSRSAFLLQEMAVARTMQAKGIGTRLLRAIETEARATEVEVIEVLTVAGKWPCYFYEKNGYDIRGHVTDQQIILGRDIAQGLTRV